MKKRLISLLPLLFLWSINIYANESIITYVHSSGIGKIAVKLTAPEIQRYAEGAPIVVEVSTFFTPVNRFTEELDVTQLGCLHLSYLWPGKTDAVTGAHSDGVYDYGGENCIAALKDVLRFACGDLADVQGRTIGEIAAAPVLTDNVGLYAFSHPGIAAVNVLALYGEQFDVKYFVGRENPTNDVLCCVEIGHWGDHHEPIFNPFYSYPECYTDTVLQVDYSTVGWLVNADYADGRPYFAVEGGEHYVLGDRIPRMWDKRYYSVQMIEALINNDALDPNNWPGDLCTLEEAQRDWEFRSSVYRYQDIGDRLPDLKVMLIFAKDDHVHPALDKPHIHQAYNGFRKQNLWVRLNPDRAYVQSVNADFGNFPDNAANSEPANWEQVRDWAYPNKGASATFVSLAAVAEMADRLHYRNWEVNLDSVLQAVFPDSQQTDVAINSENNFTPSAIKLFSNFPNPFNPRTTIEYQLTAPGQVELVVYDIRGRRVRTLVRGGQPAGLHTAIWDGRDERGKEMASGLYFYQLRAEDQMQRRRMILLR